MWNWVLLGISHNSLLLTQSFGLLVLRSWAISKCLKICLWDTYQEFRTDCCCWACSLSHHKRALAVDLRHFVNRFWGSAFTFSLSAKSSVPWILYWYFRTLNSPLWAIPHGLDTPLQRGTPLCSSASVETWFHCLSRVEIAWPVTCLLIPVPLNCTCAWGASITDWQHQIESRVPEPSQNKSSFVPLLQSFKQPYHQQFRNFKTCWNCNRWVFLSAVPAKQPWFSGSLQGKILKNCCQFRFPKKLTVCCWTEWIRFLVRL